MDLYSEPFPRSWATMDVFLSILFTSQIVLFLLTFRGAVLSERCSSAQSFQHWTSVLVGIYGTCSTSTILFVLWVDRQLSWCRTVQPMASQHWGWCGVTPEPCRLGVTPEQGWSGVTIVTCLYGVTPKLFAVVWLHRRVDVVLLHYPVNVVWL
jgi:hypothetical protein